MKPEVLDALKGSIQKWENIVAETGTDEGTANCPLCKMFFSPIEPCYGCPVSKASMHGWCQNTPYTETLAAVDALQEHVEQFYDAEKGTYTKPEVHKELIERVLQSRQAELDFLRSLLPKEEA